MCWPFCQRKLIRDSPLLFILKFLCSHYESPRTWLRCMAPTLVVHCKVGNEDRNGFCPAVHARCMQRGHCRSRVLPLTLLTAASRVTMGVHPLSSPGDKMWKSPSADLQEWDKPDWKLISMQKGGIKSGLSSNTFMNQKMLPAIPANNDVAGHQAISHCRCPDSVCLGEFRKEKNRMVALDSLDAYQENNLNESRLSHLPIHKKAQKSLTCNVCFLWLAVIFCCGTTCFCFGLFFFPPSKASHISWLSPNLFWTVPQSYLRT